MVAAFKRAAEDGQESEKLDLLGRGSPAEKGKPGRKKGRKRQVEMLKL